MLDDYLGGIVALTDEVQNRYSAQILINLTNPQNTSATTLDTTRMNNAVTDVQADFKIEAGTTYDNSVDTHVVVATEGVYAKLVLRSGQSGEAGFRLHESYLEKLRRLALITGRDRISPSTDSLLTPTQDESGDLPAFDRKNFKGYIPNAPSQPTTGD